jgi:hypothetical protein
MAMAPAGAYAVPARAAGNEAESAADQLTPFVRAAWKTTRPVETTCSGKKSPYTCSWWILKVANDKRIKASAADLPSQSITGVLARRGEGNSHSRSGTVWKSGRALAYWNKSFFSFSAY